MLLRHSLPGSVSAWPSFSLAGHRDRRRHTLPSPASEMPVWGRPRPHRGGGPPRRLAGQPPPPAVAARIFYPADGAGPSRSSFFPPPRRSARAINPAGVHSARHGYVCVTCSVSAVTQPSWENSWNELRSLRRAAANLQNAVDTGPWTSPSPSINWKSKLSAGRSPPRPPAASTGWRSPGILFGAYATLAVAGEVLGKPGRGCPWPTTVQAAIPMVPRAQGRNTRSDLGKITIPCRAHDATKHAAHRQHQSGGRVPSITPTAPTSTR